MRRRGCFTGAGSLIMVLVFSGCAMGRQDFSETAPVEAKKQIHAGAPAALSAGAARAMLVNAAAHPTLMEWKDRRFSADFPGELCRRMEGAYPGAVCLFVNGAAGDSRPRDNALGAGPEERVERLGGFLAEGAQGLISGMEPQAKADLAAWGMWVPLPKVQVRLGPVPVPSRIGSLMRPTAELGTELKQRIRGRPGKETLVIGYANGYLGYAVTPERYSSGSYESSMSWYGKEFGPYLLDRLQRMAALLDEGRRK